MTTIPEYASPLRATCAAMRHPALVLLPVLVTVAGCHAARTKDRTSAPAAADALFVAAPRDSCERAQRRAEQAPVFRVMREAKPLKANERPAYPLRERPRRYQQVTVKFLVTPAGQVDTTSVRILSSSGPFFDDAVRTVLPRWRFAPAELVPGCRVWFELTMPIVFHVPPGVIQAERSPD